MLFYCLSFFYRLILFKKKKSLPSSSHIHNPHAISISRSIFYYIYCANITSTPWTPIRKKNNIKTGIPSPHVMSTTLLHIEIIHITSPESLHLILDICQKKKICVSHSNNFCRIQRNWYTYDMLCCFWQNL